MAEPLVPNGSPGRLAAHEAVDLAGQVADLAKAGLPLDAGLRALADELPRGRLAHALRATAARLQAGQPLDAALQAEGSRLPADVRGLILAGLRTGRLAETLEEFVDLKRSQIELRRRVWLAVAYPLLLLAMLFALAVFLEVMVVPAMAAVFRDFEAVLPNMTTWIIATSGGVGLTFAALILLPIALTIFLATVLPGEAWAVRLLHLFPLVGPLWRFSGLAQCARMVAMLLGQQLPLPEALRLTAAGLRDGELAAGCRLAAQDVEAGRPVAESLAAHRQFPPTMIPLAEWGQRQSALPDAFRAIAEMFEGRVQSQGVLLETVLLPVAFLLVAATIGVFIVGLLMPMISLIEKLTS